jgi:hypothetical protein
MENYKPACCIAGLFLYVTGPGQPFCTYLVQQLKWHLLCVAFSMQDVTELLSLLDQRHKRCSSNII